MPAMRFTWEIKIPEIALEYPNRAEVVREMAESVRDAVVDRARDGQDARGPMPSPQDGGRPLDRTGTLVKSIAVRMTERRGEPVGIVRPMGPRPEDERTKIARAKKAARARSKALRAAGQKGARVRTVVDQASLAAILSQPDKLGRRKHQYRVVEATDADRRHAAEIGQERLRVRVVQIGSRVIRSQR